MTQTQRIGEEKNRKIDPTILTTQLPKIVLESEAFPLCCLSSVDCGRSYISSHRISSHPVFSFPLLFLQLDELLMTPATSRKEEEERGTREILLLFFAPRAEKKEQYTTTTTPLFFSSCGGCRFRSGGGGVCSSSFPKSGIWLRKLGVETIFS